MGWLKDIGKAIVHPFSIGSDLIEKGVKEVGSSLDDALGLDMSGYEAGRTAKRAADIQERAGLEALEQLRSGLSPYAQQGEQAVGQLSESILGPGAIGAYRAPSALDIPQASTVTAQDVMRDPFFGQLAEQQEERLLRERAGLGLAGSGGTQDLLQRNLLTLGEGFRQQRQAEELARQQQQFGQSVAASQLAQQQQQQQFGQEAGLQQQRFNQLMGLSQLGQQSAALTGSTGANLLTGIGAGQSAAALAGQQARAQNVAGLYGLAGTLGGAALLPGPIGAGSALGGGTVGLFS